VPTYDYRCSKCGHVFEGVAKMSDPNPNCPQKDCGAQTEKAFLGPRPTPQFLGGGWAKDGYSSKKR